MRILFIHVSKNWQGRVYPEYPLGIGLIATLTKQAGHDVWLHDMAVDDTLLNPWCRSGDRMSSRCRSSRPQLPWLARRSCV